MHITQAEVLAFLNQIEVGDVTLTSDVDPQETTKGDIHYEASNGWTIIVSNWSGEFAGIVEICLPDGTCLDSEYFEQNMPDVDLYFPDAEVAWHAYRMKPVETGFIYKSIDKLGPFENASTGKIIANPDRSPPWIVVSHSLKDTNVARWPGQLWLAQVVDKLEPQDHRGNYTRCVSVKLIREMPTEHLFGTHGRDVEQVLEYAYTLTLDQAKRLAECRHERAKALQSAGWHRWMAHNEGSAISGTRDMSGVVAAGNSKPRSPIGHGLSLAHSLTRAAAIRTVGYENAIEEDEEESWLVSPWSDAASALMDTAWAKGAPQFFEKSELDILLHAWNNKAAK